MKNEYKTARIVKIEKETKQVKTFVLDTKIEAKPGQYLMVWLPRLNEKPFGVASVDPLTLSIAKVGPFTEKIHQLKKGDQITYRGPYGSSFTPKGKNVLIIGGGYGVVPLYFFASSMPQIKRKYITVIIGAKTKSELTYITKFKKLGCKVYVTTDNGTAGFKGFTTQLAEKLMKKQRFDSIYTCGPEIMMKKVSQMCKEQKIVCQISAERMFKCGGIGLCGECSLKGFLVCKDGPVFPGKILLE